MGVDAIIGLSAIFIFWAGILAIVSSRLVINNWQHYVNWRYQDRDTQIRLSLWLCTPILFATLTWQHAVALINYALASTIPLVSIIQILIYRPIMLFAIALALWYTFNRVYYPHFDFIDRLWLAIVAIGGILGVAATALSFWY